MPAPLHIYDGSANRWILNPVYQGENGKGDAYASYAQAQQAEAGTYGASGGTQDDGSDKLYAHLDKATDKAFGYQKQIMGVTNEYRTKEGATQGQMDDRAFQRLGAELETRKYMQQKGQDLTNWQRDQDQRRAITSFKQR